MRQIEMTIYTKNGATWTQGRTTTDETEIYKSLAAGLLHKKIHKCSYIKSIKDACNYDGTRNVTVYYDNGVKALYTIADR